MSAAAFSALLYKLFPFKMIYKNFFVLLLPVLVISDHPGFPRPPNPDKLLLKQQNKVDKIWNMLSRYSEIYAWLIPIWRPPPHRCFKIYTDTIFILFSNLVQTRKTRKVYTILMWYIVNMVCLPGWSVLAWPQQCFDGPLQVLQRTPPPFI